MPEERRKYPRVAQRIKIRWSGDGADKLTRDYVDSVAKDVSLGGMFLVTKRPLPKGSLVTLRFSGDPLVQVKGIVRWSRRWLPPRGMGVAFYEFEGLAGQDRQIWLNGVLEKG